MRIIKLPCVRLVHVADKKSKSPVNQFVKTEMDKNQATCVDPELEVLVPPKNSTTVQHVENTSFSGLFTQVCAGVIKF